VQIEERKTSEESATSFVYMERYLGTKAQLLFNVFFVSFEWNSFTIQMTRSSKRIKLKHHQEAAEL
jgi:hypothetical protein